MKRTRHLLQNGLRELLRQKTLDEIGVQDITGAATVNRATFYDHYTDKFSLFTSMIASDFHKALEERQVNFKDGEAAGLTGIVRVLFDYLGSHSSCARHNSFAPLMDSAITLAIRHVIAGALPKEAKTGVPRDIVAATVSSAIFGAVRAAASAGPVDESTISAIVQLVLPLYQVMRPVS
jgi:AcrR family transcriptional regulator